jgi:hypothetical protein
MLSILGNAGGSQPQRGAYADQSRAHVMFRLPNPAPFRIGKWFGDLICAEKAEKYATSDKRESGFWWSGEGAPVKRAIFASHQNAGVAKTAKQADEL